MDLEYTVRIHGRLVCCLGSDYALCHTVMGLSSSSPRSRRDSTRCCSDASMFGVTKPSFPAVVTAEPLLGRTGNETLRWWSAFSSAARAAFAAPAVAPGGNCGKRFVEAAPPLTPGWRPRLGRVITRLLTASSVMSSEAVVTETIKRRTQQSVINQQSSCMGLVSSYMNEQRTLH